MEKHQKVFLLSEVLKDQKGFSVKYQKVFLVKDQQAFLVKDQKVV